MACGQSDPALAAANSEIHLVAEHIRGNWSRFAFDGANTCTHRQHLGKYVLSLCINSTWRAFRLHAKTGVVISGPFAVWRRTARMRACEFLTLTRWPNKGFQTMSNEPFGWYRCCAEARMYVLGRSFPNSGRNGDSNLHPPHHLPAPASRVKEVRRWPD
jgi:hypothetical protein